VTAPEVSIVVLNYNGRRWLGPCLDALRAQAGAPPFETILVDNASADASAAYVRETFPGVRVIETGSNLGFAAGNNAGARAATGARLAFLNNDTVAAPDWLAQLSRALDTRPSFGLATSRIVQMDDPARLDSAGDGYLRAGGAYKRGHGRPEADYASPREVFGACGAAFMIRREVFEALDGFDESFFMVYEDVDLSYRARLLGYGCWYAAEAVVRHAGSATLGRVSPGAVFYGQRNLEWTWIKNTPSPLIWRSLPAHVVYSIAGVAHYARMGRLLPALRGKLAALAGMPAALRARRRIQSSARPGGALEELMDRGWLELKRSEKRAARR
jgi:N-acetylglucosaminyl-diphospho-decaprenol L-rhamnosyltransferase